LERCQFLKQRRVRDGDGQDASTKAINLGMAATWLTYSLSPSGFKFPRRLNPR
jgi:hypothetical protein